MVTVKNCCRLGTETLETRAVLHFPPLKQNEVGPRRLATTFTRKRNVSEMIDTTTQCITTSHNQLVAASASPTTFAYGNWANPEAAKPKQKHVRLITEKRREQCRTSQARYRLRQRGHVCELQTHIHQLHEEVEQLTVERNALWYGALTKHDAWSVVVEYFRLFRHGYHIQMKPTGASPATSLPDQECFLRGAMSPTVAFGESSGVDSLIEQWKRYSAYFEDLHFQLEKMEQKSSGIMATSATLSLTISVMTLAFVFPHLLSSPSPDNSRAAGNYSRLACRLLGQRLDCGCSIRFVWDDKSRRLTRLDPMMDLFTPLMRVLGSLEDVSCVLEKAHLTPSLMLEKTHVTPIHLAVDLRGTVKNK